MVAKTSQGSLARAFLRFPPIDLPLSKLPALCLASCFFPGAQQYAQMSIKDMAIQGVFNFFLQLFSCFFPVFFRQPGGNECNTTGALRNAFTPLWLESTGHRGDFHTDLWSWAGFWTVLHGF